MKSLAALTLFTTTLSHSLLAQTELPTTEQFQGLLTTCAAGARIEIDGEIRGSFTSVYDEATTQAKDFKILTLTDFLNSLPEKDKLAGFKLYNECVLRILRGDLEQADAVPELIELPKEIITSGEDLVIKAVTLVANDTEIRSFPSGSRAANGKSGSSGKNGGNGKNGSGGAGGNGSSGGAGGHGGNGLSSGKIVIEAETFIGSLSIFNNGSTGGNGGPGGTGGSGGAGGQGGNSVSGMVDCRRGPGNGGAGGNAGAGGDSGRGGNGGNGGTVIVKIDSVVPGSKLTVTSIGGAAGQAGNPGQPGTIGRGGPRGNSGGRCGSGGRVAGANGVPAGAGRNLGPGQAGSDGQIEIVIGGQTSIGTGRFSKSFE